MAFRSVIGTLVSVVGLSMLGCVGEPADPDPNEEAAVEETEDVGSVSSELTYSAQCVIHNYPSGNQCYSPQIGWNDCNNPTISPSPSYCDFISNNCSYTGSAKKTNAYWSGDHWVGVYSVSVFCY